MAVALPCDSCRDIGILIQTRCRGGVVIALASKANSLWEPRFES